MYNNLTQQTPYYPYPYGMPYQRQIQEPQNNATILQPLIKGRPVVSIDEAKAAQIDLDGSLFVFPDIGNKKIYTKQINMDGTATFNIFELAATPEPAAPPAYVTKDELDAILVQFKASLTQSNGSEPGPAQKLKTYDL